MLPGLTSAIRATAAAHGFTLFAEVRATGSSVTWPTGLAADDFAVLVDAAANLSSAIPTAVTPTGFTNDINLSAGNTTRGTRIMLSHKLLVGTESGSLAGMSGGNAGRAKTLLIFRPDFNVGTVTFGGGVSVQNAGDPAAQTILAAGQPSPLIVVGAFSSYETYSDPTAWGSASPAFEGSYGRMSASGDVGTLTSYSVYNSDETPVSHTIDIADLGFVNTIVGGYFTFTKV